MPSTSQGLRDPRGHACCCSRAAHGARRAAGDAVAVTDGELCATAIHTSRSAAWGRGPRTPAPIQSGLPAVFLCHIANVSFQEFSKLWDVCGSSESGLLSSQYPLCGLPLLITRTSNPDISGFKSRPRPLRTGRSGGRFLAPLRFSFLVCKMGRVVVFCR